MLQTKFYLPQVRSELVSRPRLFTHLDRSPNTRLLLISAPAGFGKSTLIGQWLRARQMEGSTAWISLDAGDNDPIRFWRYSVAGLNWLDSEIGQPALAMLAASQPPPLEAILTTLINEIAELPSDIWLAFDDYHLIENPAIHTSLRFLLEHQPAHLRLAILTRSDPPLPLARLRARGELVEIRTADLRFVQEESEEYLRRASDAELTQADREALTRQTEGWIAGLQMAVLSLPSHRDAHDFVAAFAGSNRYILDYLTEEVLEEKPPPVKEFLLQTSILNRFCPSLCDAVTGRQDSRQMLQWLEETNLFLTPLDDQRQWYRYHHLFADLLRSRLGERGRAQVEQLHRQAALWHRQNGSTAESLEHSIAAQAWDEAAELIQELADVMWRRGEILQVAGWIAQLPQPLVRQKPYLCLTQARIFAHTGPFDEAESWLDRTEELAKLGDAQALQGEVTAIRAGIAAMEGDTARSILLCRSALAMVPADQQELRLSLLLCLGTALRFGGETVAAVEALQETYQLTRRTGDLYHSIDTLCNLGLAQVAQSQLPAAYQSYQTALSLCTVESGSLFLFAGEVFVVLADLLREWNQLESAEYYLFQGIKLSEEGSLIDIGRTAQ